jgi:hypothetical protein
MRRAELNGGRCAVVLTPPARRVHLAVLSAFAETGRRLPRGELERIARGQGADPGAVLAELTGCDLLALDGSGEIRAAYPFSPSPTAVQVSWEGGPRAYAMCAIDALGMSAMLDRPVTITAREPDSGRPVTVEVYRTSARWRPGRAVDRCCGHINFFTGARAAREWASRHPEVTGTTLGRAQALRHGIAEFGTLMRAGSG